MRIGFGEPMTDDNIWLRGRNEERSALDGILLAIDGVRRADGSLFPFGARVRLSSVQAPEHKQRDDTETST
jgi:hypothetical protein